MADSACQARGEGCWVMPNATLTGARALVQTEGAFADGRPVE